MNYQKKLFIKSNITKTKNYIGDLLGKEFYRRLLDPLKCFRLHPSMCFFLLGNRKTIPIINFHKGFHFLIKAIYVISRIIKKKGHLLIVNTHPALSSFIENLIESTSPLLVSYCNKWVGGTLTNWRQVSKSIIEFGYLSKKSGTSIATTRLLHGRRNKKAHAKRERRNKIRYKKMRQSFKGFINKKKAYLNVKMPDIILVINPDENSKVIDEAIRKDIPVIAITDSKTKILGITYPIPANFHSFEFIHLFISWIIRLCRKK